MLGEHLKRLIGDGKTSVSELSQIARYGESTIYDWLAGKTRFPLDAVENWIALHPSVEVREVVLASVSRGTARLAILPSQSDDDLDRNGDGRIDADDGRIAACDACDHAVSQMREMVSSFADGQISDAEYASLRKAHLLLRQAADAVMDIAARSRAPQRRHARPLTLKAGA